MRYIEPTMKITAFDTSDVITTSGPGDEIFAATGDENAKDLTNTYPVNVQEAMGLMK